MISQVVDNQKSIDTTLFSIGELIKYSGLNRNQLSYLINNSMIYGQGSEPRLYSYQELLYSRLNKLLRFAATPNLINQILLSAEFLGDDLKKQSMLIIDFENKETIFHKDIPSTQLSSMINRIFYHDKVCQMKQSGEIKQHNYFKVNLKAMRSQLEEMTKDD